MKTILFSFARKGTVATLLLCFMLISSCHFIQLNKINPYNDFTSDQLRNYDVEKIRIVTPDSLSVYPGSSFSIGVIAETPFRKELKTRGMCNGFVNWNSYSIHVQGGVFDHGIVTIYDDPRKVGTSITISITPYSKLELKQEISLPISYATKFIANCKGQNGLGGFDGLTGDEIRQLDTSGSWNSNNGRYGQPGTDGETGSDGCVADVFVKAKIIAGKKMMSVLVINHCDNNHLIYWIDPNGGSLLVDVSGGDGGNGGNGGNGEKGKDGIGVSFVTPDPIFYPINTQPYPLYNTLDPYFYRPDFNYVDLTPDPTRTSDCNGGNGGYGGNGGTGGNGGNGGVAIIHLDSSAVQWKNKITVINTGGKNGMAGKGGYAGAGGKSGYGMIHAYNGNDGFMGANGLKSIPGNPGSLTIWKEEEVDLTW